MDLWCYDFPVLSHLYHSQVEKGKWLHQGQKAQEEEKGLEFVRKKVELVFEELQEKRKLSFLFWCLREWQVFQEENRGDYSFEISQNKTSLNQFFNQFITDL
jgi:hypothetical protein